ncbi:hypothetical protein GQR58_017786 [Nymphon striatum]|nr:hypothetical protein GQR58_017786 [Nymphon striatum]
MKLPAETLLQNRTQILNKYASQLLTLVTNTKIVDQEEPINDIESNSDFHDAPDGILNKLNKSFFDPVVICSNNEFEVIKSQLKNAEELISRIPNKTIYCDQDVTDYLLSIDNLLAEKHEQFYSMKLCPQELHKKHRIKPNEFSQSLAFTNNLFLQLKTLSHDMQIQRISSDLRRLLISTMVVMINTDQFNLESTLMFQDSSQMKNWKKLAQKFCKDLKWHVNLLSVIDSLCSNRLMEVVQVCQKSSLTRKSVIKRIAIMSYFSEDIVDLEQNSPKNSVDCTELNNQKENLSQEAHEANVYVVKYIIERLREVGVSCQTITNHLCLSISNVVLLNESKWERQTITESEAVQNSYNQQHNDFIHKTSNLCLLVKKVMKMVGKENFQVKLDYVKGFIGDVVELERVYNQIRHLGNKCSDLNQMFQDSEDRMESLNSVKSVFKSFEAEILKHYSIDPSNFNYAKEWFSSNEEIIKMHLKCSEIEIYEEAVFELEKLKKELLFFQNILKVARINNEKTFDSNIEIDLNEVEENLNLLDQRISNKVVYLNTVLQKYDDFMEAIVQIKNEITSIRESIVSNLELSNSENSDKALDIIDVIRSKLLNVKNYTAKILKANKSTTDSFPELFHRFDLLIRPLKNELKELDEKLNNQKENLKSQEEKFEENYNCEISTLQSVIDVELTPSYDDQTLVTYWNVNNLICVYEELSENVNEIISQTSVSQDKKEHGVFNHEANLDEQRMVRWTICISIMSDHKKTDKKGTHTKYYHSRPHRQVQTRNLADDVFLLSESLQELQLMVKGPRPVINKVRDLGNYRYLVEKISECPTQYRKKDPRYYTIDKSIQSQLEYLNLRQEAFIDASNVFQSLNDTVTVKSIEEVESCFEMSNNIFNESERFPSMPSSAPLAQKFIRIKNNFQKLQVAEGVEYLEQLQLSVTDVSKSVEEFNDFYQNHVSSENCIANFFVVIIHFHTSLHARYASECRILCLNLKKKKKGVSFKIKQKTLILAENVKFFTKKNICTEMIQSFSSLQTSAQLFSFNELEITNYNEVRSSLQQSYRAWKDSFYLLLKIFLHPLSQFNETNFSVNSVLPDLIQSIQNDLDSIPPFYHSIGEVNSHLFKLQLDAFLLKTVYNLDKPPNRSEANNNDKPSNNRIESVLSSLDRDINHLSCILPIWNEFKAKELQIRYFLKRLILRYNHTLNLIPEIGIYSSITKLENLLCDQETIHQRLESFRTEINDLCQYFNESSIKKCDKFLATELRLVCDLQVDMKSMLDDINELKNWDSAYYLTIINSQYELEEFISSDKSNSLLPEEICDKISSFIEECVCAKESLPPKSFKIMPHQFEAKYYTIDSYHKRWKFSNQQLLLKHHTDCQNLPEFLERYNEIILWIQNVKIHVNNLPKTLESVKYFAKGRIALMNGFAMHFLLYHWKKNAELRNKKEMLSCAWNHMLQDYSSRLKKCKKEVLVMKELKENLSSLQSDVLNLESAIDCPPLSISNAENLSPYFQDLDKVHKNIFLEHKVLNKQLNDSLQQGLHCNEDVNSFKHLLDVLKKRLQTSNAVILQNMMKADVSDQRDQWDQFRSQCKYVEDKISAIQNELKEPKSEAMLWTYKILASELNCFLMAQKKLERLNDEIANATTLLKALENKENVDRVEAAKTKFKNIQIKWNSLNDHLKIISDRLTHSLKGKRMYEENVAVLNTFLIEQDVGMYKLISLDAHTKEKMGEIMIEKIKCAFDSKKELLDLTKKQSLYLMMRSEPSECPRFEMLFKDVETMWSRLYSQLEPPAKQKETNTQLETNPMNLNNGSNKKRQSYWLWWKRVVRSALPFQALGLLLLATAALVPFSEVDFSCKLSNSLMPTLHYDSPPPI